MGKVVMIWARVAASGLPIIAIWQGSVATIPDGWSLCEELIDHWPMGVEQADGSDLATTGGTVSVSLSHLHTWDTAPFPPLRSDDESSHGHASGFGSSAVALGPPPGFAGAVTDAQPATHDHAADGITTATYPHSHAIEGATDADTFDQNLQPPYDARAYMRGSAEIPIGAVALFDRPVSALLGFTAGPTTTLTVDVDDTTVFELWTGMDPTITLATPFTFYVDDEAAQCLTVSEFGWFVERGQSGTAKTAHTTGAVVMFPRYAVCDGSSGTPSLRGGFIIGADGVTYDLGSFYGSDSAFAPITHVHPTDDLIVGITGHVHKLLSGQLPPAVGLAVVDVGLGFPVAALPSHVHEIADQLGDIGGTHAHTLTTESASPNGTWTPASFSPLPPYYRLYFIQRVDYGDVTSDTCPLGTILHTPGAAPANWAICDGSGGTPPLQAKTVVGAGGAYAVGDTGGDGGFNVPPHTHGVGTSELGISSGEHDWTISTSLGGGTVGTTGGITPNADGPGIHGHPPFNVLAADPSTGIIDEEGHGHGFGGTYDDNTTTTNDTNRLPATVALNYIQRVA